MVLTVEDVCYGESQTCNESLIVHNEEMSTNNITSKIKNKELNRLQNVFVNKTLLSLNVLQYPYHIYPIGW